MAVSCSCTTPGSVAVFFASVIDVVDGVIIDPVSYIII